MRINRQIRAPKVRVIDQDGKQVGIISIDEALQLARNAGVDLVEVVPNATPPVCKIIDYGKYRYDQTKKEKESKKSQHQIKVKEVKLKPNIDVHDIETKNRHAKEFLQKGNKVKVTCTFRGREMARTEIGAKVMEEFIEDLSEWCMVESAAKLMGRTMTAVLAPRSKKGGSGKSRSHSDESPEESSEELS